jgi:chromosome partitioning protein
LTETEETIFQDNISNTGNISNTSNYNNYSNINNTNKPNKPDNMIKCIAFSNHKGGVGKTTSTVNIGAGLSLLKKKVLLVDLDPQGNLSQCLGVNSASKNIYGFVKKQYPLEPVNVIKNLDILPSNVDLAGLEIELNTEPGREYVIKELIEKVSANYDFILIDCPPSLGLLTLNAFTAATKVIIPLQAEYLAMHGLSKLIEVVSKIQTRINPNLDIEGVIITQYDKRKILNKDIAATVGDHFGNKVFKTFIRDNISLAEAPSSGLDIFRYNPNSNGAEDYLNLSKEILIRFTK